MEEDCPHSSSAKINLIASVVVEKNMFLDLLLYKNLKLGRLRKYSIVILLTEKVRNTS